MNRTLSNQQVSPASCALSPTTPPPGWHPLFARALNNRLLLLIVTLLFFSGAFAQTTTTFPAASACTSKDLELVGAALTGGDPCNSCEPNTTITRTLTLSINNTTKSTRTSFAFWGTLERTDANGNVTTTPISGCNGPIEKGIVNSLNYGQVTYTCGDAIKIKNLMLAWTDASDKSTCGSINSATINPKCGTLPEIVVNVGVNGNLTQNNLTCFGANNGSINLTPFGGAPPYTFSWTASGGGVVPTGKSAMEDLTGLVAGTYTVTVRDSKNCSVIKSRTITGPSAGLTLGSCSKTDVSCSGSSNGSIAAGAVSNASGTPQYSWKNASNVSVGTTASVNGLAAGTYTLTVTDNCSSATCAVTVMAPTPPSTPYVVISKYPDCSSAEGTLQVKVNANTNYSSDYEFSSDGVTFVNSNEFSFIAGQGYQVYVRAKGTTCAASASCPAQAAKPSSASTVQLSPVKLPVTEIADSELKIKAYPNPFNQKINFVVSSPVSGKGSLEVYNSMGQKVKTVYVGMISRGSQTFELNLPAHKTSNLLYVLRVGNQRISGKILQLNH